MVIYTKENGLMVKLMAWAYSSIPTGRCMKVTGRTISSMVTEQNLGITTRSSLQAISLKEKRQAKVDLNLKVAIMKEISSMVNSMG